MRKIKFILIVLAILFISAPLLYGQSRTHRQLRIGSRIGGSTSGSMLYIDSNKKLAEDDVSWDDVNERMEIASTDPEIRLIDTGDSEYTRITRADTSKKAQRFNRTTKAGGAISNLIDHWKMNDNAANTTVDDSVGSFDGTAQRNTEDISVAGQINTGLLFNGSSDWVEVGNISGTIFSGDFSICVWVNPLDVTAFEVIFDKRVGNNSGTMLFMDDGIVKIAIDSDDTIVDTALSSGVYQHVVITRSGTIVKIYFDSISQTLASGGTSSADGSNSQSAIIGVRSFSTKTFNYAGDLDDFRIYEKALNQAEIDAIYNSGNGTEGNATAGATTEATVWTSEDGSDAFEQGVQTFGDGEGRTVLNGQTVRFNINSSEVGRIDASGNLGLGTVAPTELLDINSDGIRIRTSQTPASPTATGDQGQIGWDANYIYVCIAANTWVRTALSTWAIAVFNIVLDDGVSKILLDDGTSALIGR